MSTPTPRTDAAVTLTIGADFNSVCPNFARTLEIELNAATAERDQLRADLADQAARFHDEIVRRQGTVRNNHELNLNHFRAELAAECLEQARLLGKSAEREAAAALWGWVRGRRSARSNRSSEIKFFDEL